MRGDLRVTVQSWKVGSEKERGGVNCRNKWTFSTKIQLLLATENFEVISGTVKVVGKTKDL